MMSERKTEKDAKGWKSRERRNKLLRCSSMSREKKFFFLWRETAFFSVSLFYLSMFFMLHTTSVAICTSLKTENSKFMLHVTKSGWFQIQHFCATLNPVTKRFWSRSSHSPQDRESTIFQERERERRWTSLWEPHSNFERERKGKREKGFTVVATFSFFLFAKHVWSEGFIHGRNARG